MKRTPGDAPIALLGARCSGKSSVALRLGPALGRSMIDLDQETLRLGRWAGFRAGGVGALLVQAGQARFRDIEAAALRRILEPTPRCVLATGGGVVEREDNRAWLERTACCVFLSVPAEILAARLRADPTLRPALLGDDPATEAGELLVRREPLYRSLAAFVIECGDASPEELAQRIRSELGVDA